MAVIAALVIAGYASFLSTGLLGYDTYPTILTAKIGSMQDFFGTFSEQLMDGRFRPGGVFWRPLTNLTFAADYARGGLDPTTYHQTDLAVLIGCGWACFACTRRIAGRGGLLAAAFAGILFVIHPVHVEVFPVPARRADMMAIGLVMACLAAQPKCGERIARLRWFGLFALSLLAMGAKETGTLVLPLVICLHGLDWFAGRFIKAEAQARLVGVLRACAPTLLAFIVYAVGRTAALGGLGGHPDSSLLDIVGMFSLVEPYADWLLMPERFQTAWGKLQILLALLTGTALGGSFRPRAWRGTKTDGACLKSPTRAFAFVLLFLLGLLAVHSTAGGRVEPWYAAVFCGPYAIGLGLLFGAGVDHLRARAVVGGAWLVLLPLGLAAHHFVWSPLMHDYPTWQRATVAMEDFLERFDTRLNAAKLGEPILLDQLPLTMPPPTTGPGVRSAVMLNTYTLEAYAELTRPDVKIHVHSLIGGPPPHLLPADEIGVWVTPGRAPGAAPQQGAGR
ncbi:MAG: hypothetical protein ACI835_004644 [Planctomycetota bacterium]|jgi:hypothetical protein